MKENLNGIQAAYFIELLFEKDSTAIDADKISSLVSSEISENEIIFDSDDFNIFFLKNYVITNNDGKKSFAGLSMSKNYLSFNKDEISDLEFSQYIYQPISENSETPNKLLNMCTKKILIGDWMCAFLPYKKRCFLLHKFIKLILTEFPECKLIRVPSSGRLLTKEDFLNNPWPDNISFINEGITFRIFQITDEKTPEFVADTLGLYAIGLPDLQVHFHTLDPSDVINRLEDYAVYIFSKGNIIRDDEKVSGLSENEFWYCQHEKSIIPPYREVLDFEAGKFSPKR
ncbi:MAG: DUF4261 domain-containing protein [Clostridium sp.]